jgi:hypothetical protein
MNKFDKNCVPFFAKLSFFESWSAASIKERKLIKGGNYKFLGDFDHRNYSRVYILITFLEC